MKLVKSEKVIDIIQRTLDNVDSRLISHGRRVSYLVFKLLETQGRYTDKELHDICILAILHDIGAYKTEEIDRMVNFETVNVWRHSIYGYLFIKYFSPLRDLSPAILFHHVECSELKGVHPSYQYLAQIISLCDRADIYSAGNDMKCFKNEIERYRDIKFWSDIMDLFFAADIDFNSINEMMYSDEKYLNILYGLDMRDDEIFSYIRMIILTIDFRSHHTVLHSIAIACISQTIARLMGLDEEEIEIIRTAAMFHDIGKIGIPVSILEKPDKLDKDEMSVMKTHVNITEKILSGCVEDNILRIAIRHHEKLNGTGYPRGLDEKDLSQSDRILAVADIFSALCGTRSYKDAYHKEQIVTILKSMSHQSEIDTEIVSTTVKGFDLIMEALDQKTQPIIELYDKINEEYEKLFHEHVVENVDGLFGEAHNGYQH